MSAKLSPVQKRESMPQTIVEKIAQAHMTEGPNRPLRAGDFLSIRPFHVMTHDNTSAVMKKFGAIGATRVYDPAQPVFTADHDIQNTEESNLAKYRSMEAFAREQGIDFYPPGTGIGHQIMVEQGYVLPGTFVVASDSHSNMYGALGAIGTPVVRTDAAAIWATGEFWWQIPRTIQVVLEGKLSPGVTGKDVIITLCGLYNHEEVLNAAVEFAGPGVTSLSMDARLSIANMTTEWGALVGWLPVDDVTLTYLDARNRELRRRGIARIPEEKLCEWQTNPLAPDADAAYAGRIMLDLAEVTPHVSGPDTVQVMQSVAEIAKKKVAIQKAYLVSCVNSRTRRSGSGGEGFARKEGRGKRAVLPGCGQPVSSRGSREARASGRSFSMRARTHCRQDAGRASGLALDCWKQARLVFPRPTAISKDAWARAMRNATLAARRSWLHRRSRDTSVVPRCVTTTLWYIASTRSLGSSRRRRLLFFPDSQPEFAGGLFFCRKTI